MKYLFLSTLFALAVTACDTDKRTFAVIETEFGDMKAVLYDETPKHRDNFIKLAKEGYYDSLLFHRVIKGFMIQGGDPDSKDARPGQMLGGGGPGYQIDAEFTADHVHVRGALAAARTGGAGNPEKKSSGSQFYIVQGQQVTDQQLDGFERQKNITYTEEQRQIYKEEGGAPFLDMEYTVFGRVVEGLEVIDKITSVETGPRDRPVEDVEMRIRILD